MTCSECAALKTAPSHHVAFAEHAHQIASSSLWTSLDCALPAATVPVPAEGTGKRKQHRPPTPRLVTSFNIACTAFGDNVTSLLGLMLMLIFRLWRRRCAAVSRSVIESASPSLFPSPQMSGHMLQMTPKSANNSKSTPCRATSPTPTLTPPVPVTYN